MLDYVSVTLAGVELLKLVEDGDLRARIDQFLVLAQPHVERELTRLVHGIIDDVNDAVSDHYRVRLVHEDCANFVEVVRKPDPDDGAAWAEIQAERREIAEAVLPPGEDSGDD